MKLSTDFSMVLKNLKANIKESHLVITVQFDNLLRLAVIFYYHYYFLLYYTDEEKTEIVKILDFWFLTDLHILRYPEHDFTIFRKCRSIGMARILHPS